MIVVDVETGGLDPDKNPLLSVGAVDFDKDSNTFYGKCHPFGPCEITAEALEVNGIDIKEWDNNQSLQKMMESFVKWLKTTRDPSTLAGHNPRFDLDFLYVNALRCGVKLPFSYRTVDLHTLAYMHRMKNYPSVSETKMTSENIYKYLDLPVEPRPHNALTGAKYETVAFKALLGRL